MLRVYRLGDRGGLGEERRILVQRAIRFTDFLLLVVAPAAAPVGGPGAVCAHDTASIVKEGVLRR